jgi:hypothetical protein
MTSKEDDDKKLPARKVPNPSLLSDPFQDEKDAEDKPRLSSDKTGQSERPSTGMPRSRSSARLSYERRRRHTSATLADVSDKRPSVSSRDEYMQGLLQQMQSLEKSLAFSMSSTGSTSSSTTRITLLSDNAKAHLSPHWNRSLLMPGLDRYHPMDDFMVYLLRRNQIHARNVRLIRDNPRSHERSRLVPNDFLLSPTSTTAREEDDSSSSLDVGGLSEYLNRRWVKTSNEHNTSSTLTATTVSLTGSGSTFSQAPEDSFSSLESSKQRLAPMKEESSNEGEDSNTESQDQSTSGRGRGTKPTPSQSSTGTLDRRQA